MMSPDENTPIRGAGKNGKTEPPAKKAAKRSRKPSHKEAAQKETVQKEAVQKEAIQKEAVQEEAVQEEASQKELAQQVAPETERMEQAEEPIAVATVAMENPSADAAPEAPAPIALAEEPAEAAPREPEQAAPVDLQTITNAYGDFTRKSIEQTGSFFEQLAGARSLSRAFELQGEFAKQTCETFFAESRKIRELHTELARQRLRNLEGFMAWMKPTRSS
jgi:Phasin protein